MVSSRSWLFLLVSKVSLLFKTKVISWKESIFLPFLYWDIITEVIYVGMGRYRDFVMVGLSFFSILQKRELLKGSEMFVLG